MRGTAVGFGPILDLTRHSLASKIAAQAQQVARLRASLQTAEQHLDELMRLRAATTPKETAHERRFV
jgi:hypothetical protein